ncbi:hypothetical protein Tdes44962_MAKER01065 [Teratosphaeria destructans]|uniref:Uncharacterized protein n=1 Tax=Teratosphaeria destructans TaxID=418781 RepID=A0A9W7SID5_9PEZI|nr:hypothetical protein Tdes44962_MAKER01065 [Teratosphaeria destructans]
MVTSPNGKMRAPIIRIKPGAFSWYHGAVFVDSRAAHAKAKRHPAMKELKNILSSLMSVIVSQSTATVRYVDDSILAFATPAREHSSTVSFGV